MFSHISNQNIQLLLKNVVRVYNYKIVHSKDCDNLAYAISAKCGESISGSTVKRLFGFIKTKSLPNKFTLNLLAKYIDFEDYNAFVESNNRVGNNKKSNGLNEFIKLNLYSNNTLFNYDKGCKRLDDFINSNYRAAAIIGEGGTGKSSFLAYYLNKNQAKLNNCNVVFRVSAKYLSDYLNAIDETTQLLIIDDVEETAYNFTELRHSLILILKLLSNQSQLKLIINLRPFTWIKLIELINSDNQKKQWFGVNFEASSPLNASNVNLFIELNNKVIGNETLHTPLFVSLLNNIKSTGLINDWGLLDDFFKKHIEKTAYAFEKQCFLNCILTHTNFGLNGSTIKRELIQNLIVKYKKPHVDLVSFNIIAEHKETNKFGSFVSYYSFGKSIYFYFQILSKLLEKFNGFNNELLTYIVKHYDYENRLGLLKLAVSFALKNNDKEVAKLFDIELIEFERQALMIHLAHQIRTNKQLQTDILPLFVFSTSGRKYFIERWIDEENLSGFYGNTVSQYLKFVDSNQDVIFGNALLYYSAYLSKDFDKCETYYNRIKNTNDNDTYIHPFVLGRKYMTLLLEEHRINTDYSESTKTKIKQYLKADLKELNTDLPVHFSGFEHNILHAEFLTQHYYFTPQILKKLKHKTATQLHEFDVDIVLLNIFIQMYDKSLGKPYHIPNYKIDSQPWYKPTVNKYVALLKA